MLLGFATTILISVAGGVPVDVSDCEMDEDIFASTKTAFVTCNATNTGDHAIAHYDYTLSAKDEGREIPWLDQSEFSLSVSGGIEPGEMYQASFVAFGNLSRADPAKLIITIEITEVRGAENQTLSVD